MKHFTLGLISFVTLTFSAASYAGTCEASDPSDLDAIIKVIESKKTCYQAADVARSCAFGSTADVHMVAAATTVCAEAYEKTITQADMDIMKILFNKCNDKYADRSGTMYRSATAHCGLNVVELFASFYTVEQTVE